MKIAFVITTLTGGGAERVASRLCSRWGQDGHDVIIILTSKDSFGKTRYYDLDDSVHLVELSKDKKLGLLQKICATRQILIEQKIECVVSFFPNSSFIAQEAAKGLHIPSIVSERNDPFHNKTGFINQILKKRSFHRASVIVFQTKEVLEMFPPKIREKGIVIANPCEVKFPVGATGAHEGFRILAFGRLCPQKRFDLLIRAFRLFAETHPNARLTIFGDGPDKGPLETLIHKMSIDDNVALQPFTPDILKEIVRSDLFVMSSLFEGFPNALLECALLGVPCISTDFASGAAKQIIDHGNNGLLIPVDSAPEQLCKGIEIVYDSLPRFKENAEKMAASLAVRFDTKTIADLWIEVLRRACSNA